MKTIDFNQIKVGTNYSRQELGDISSLAASIRDHGLQQPLVVDTDDSLIAGFRRHAALKSLGFQGPLDVVVYEGENQAVINLVENIERQQLSFYEEAVAIRTLFEGCSEQEVAEYLNRTRGWSRPRIKLWSLPQEVIDKAKSGEITSTKVTALLNAPNTQEACQKFLSGEKVSQERAKPGKKELQAAITAALASGNMKVVQTLRWVLGDIQEEEFWEQVA